MSDKIVLTVNGRIATLQLNRPQKLNALDPEMLGLLETAVSQLEKSTDTTVVLLTAAGDRVFCVGADIEAWAALEPLDMWRQWVRDGHRIFDRLAALPQPVIAVLNGYTFGGGLELAMAADMRFAAEHAEFAMPEVKISTTPGWGGSQRLPALIGAARAKQMIFTGERINSEKAEQWGLINEQVSAAELMNRAQAIAETIIQNAPVSVQIAKQMINSNHQQSNMSIEALAGALTAFTADGKEGVTSFRERRPPHYQGR